MFALVKIGESGVALPVSNGFLKEHQTLNRKTVDKACLAVLEQWAEGRGARAEGA